jgi:hypothetical protein
MKLNEGVRVAVDLGKCWYMLCNYAGQKEGWLLVMTKGYVFNKEPKNLVPSVQYKSSIFYCVISPRVSKESFSFI